MQLQSIDRVSTPTIKKINQLHLISSVYNLSFCQSIQLIFYISIHFTPTLTLLQVSAFHHVVHTQHTATRNTNMASMLRSFARGGAASSRGAAFLNRVSQKNTAPAVTRLMATQSGDDAAPPTALAKLHLEDGTTLTGRSFGSHESIDGEVS